VTLSAAAAKAFKEAGADAGSDVLRLEMDDEFNADLHFGPKAVGDIEVQCAGVSLHVARASAGRADGIAIDFVEAPSGMAFKIDNPNEPPRVKPIHPQALKAMLDEGRVELFDVRPEDERAKASIAQAKPLDARGQGYLSGLDKKTAGPFTATTACAAVRLQSSCSAKALRPCTISRAVSRLGRATSIRRFRGIE
jgi:monothiol glutaredoxin